MTDFADITAKLDCPHEVIGPCLLIQADCLKVLPLLEVGSVDAVVTDPPYGIGMVAFDDSFDAGVAGFIASPGAVAAVFHSPRRVIEFAKRVDGWSFERLLWMHKTADIAAPWRGWCMNSEAIAIFSRGSHLGWPKAETYRSDTYSVGPWERAGHPNGKPLAVVLDLARRLTKPGWVVLDPFMGSGTTGVACIRTGRKFIGIELDPGYFRIACDRIRRELDTYLGGPMFAPKADNPELFQEEKKVAKS